MSDWTSHTIQQASSNARSVNAIGRVNRQRGAAIAEMVVALPILLVAILGAVQWGLIYEAKSTINHATLQAARAGSVDHANASSIRNGLARGLIPLYSPDPSVQGAATAFAEAQVDVQANSSVRILNPTQEAFEDFGENVGGQREIPNDRLYMRPTSVGGRSGLNVQDANLLRVQVRYGYELNVPIVGRFITGITSFLNSSGGRPDAFEARMLAQGRLPIISTSTVRMQTPARESSAILTRADLENPARVAGSMGEPTGAVGGGANGGGTTAVFNNGGSSIGDRFFGFNPIGRRGPLGGNGGGAGGGDGEEQEPPDDPPPGDPIECEPATVQPGADEDAGFFGNVWNHLRNIAGTAYDFVRGFWEGIKGQAADLIDMLTDPIETARGIYELAMAFIDDPEGTARQIGAAIGRDISTLVNCGAYDRGRLLGENVSPAFMLKLASKLARFGRAGLGRAVRDTRREVGSCTSFGPHTLVMTTSGLMPIANVRVGDTVLSRSELSFADKPQKVTSTFHRTAPSYRKLITERDTLEITDEHPVWVQGKGWVRAEEVEDTDVLATSSGDVVVIKNVEVHESLQVHNFSVEETENYFVGETGVWVHNAPCQIDFQSSNGRNPVLNNPQPNTRYYVDGRTIYQTDDLGRTTSVTSRIESQNIGQGIRNCYQQRTAGACDRLATDDGGHLIGTYLGGPGEAINLVPQNRTLNRGAYRTMEMEWAERADAGQRVDVTVRVEYSGDSQRPTRFIVEYSYDGVPQPPRTFRNN